METKNDWSTNFSWWGRYVRQNVGGRQQVIAEAHKLMWVAPYNSSGNAPQPSTSFCGRPVRSLRYAASVSSPIH